MSAAIHLLTIVAESVLEDRLVRDAASAGARGWTITPCRGRSANDGHGGGASDIEGGNIRMEVLIAEPQLEALWAALDANYFAAYGVVAWSVPVRVRRDSKFVSDN